MNELFSELEPEFDIGNNKKYKVKAIKDNTIYINKVEKYLLNLYYLVSWKDHSKKENT